MKKSLLNIAIIGAVAAASVFIGRSMVDTSQESVVGGSAVVAPASESSASDIADMPSQIKVAQQNGIEIIKHFEIDNGYKVWIVKNRTNYNAWYSDESGYVFVGAYLDPAGTNLTAKYLEEYAPKDTQTALLESSEYISTVKEGEVAKSKPVYVFYEPHCGYCSAFHAAAQPYIDAGADVRWIPLAFLKSKPGDATSYELLARIMDSPDPLAELDKHEEIKAANGGRGGLTKTVEPDADLFRMSEKNSTIFAEVGFSGTPAVAYVNDSGRIELIKGMPQMRDLPGMFGMERMDSDDRRLTQFRALPSVYPAK